MKVIRFLNRVLTRLEIVLLAAAIIYSGFALWDNHLVYNQVENGMREMREIKTLNGEEPLSLFDQLRSINPDVTAWLKMDGTSIDYPVLKGKSNYSYLNTDVYGDFAMAGSIYMDFRNSRDYSDSYTLLLGHDMSGHRMFSDINLYKKEEFFRENTRGILTLPDGDHELLSLSVIVTGASNALIFNPQNWKNLTAEEILEAVHQEALWLNEDGIRILESMLASESGAHIVALSTCSSEYSNARTILLTVIDPVRVKIYMPVKQAGDCFD